MPIYLIPGCGCCGGHSSSSETFIQTCNAICGTGPGSYTMESTVTLTMFSNPTCPCLAGSYILTYNPRNLIFNFAQANTHWYTPIQTICGCSGFMDLVCSSGSWELDIYWGTTTYTGAMSGCSVSFFSTGSAPCGCSGAPSNCWTQEPTGPTNIPLVGKGFVNNFACPGGCPSACTSITTETVYGLVTG